MGTDLAYGQREGVESGHLRGEAASATRAQHFIRIVAREAGYSSSPPF